MFVTRSSGVGKGYITIALGCKVCQRGLKVLYVNASRLLGQLKAIKVKGSILQELEKTERTNTLIQDSFGLWPLDNENKTHLMGIIKDWYGKKPTLITSQLPVKDRYDVIGKKTIAGVVMDRVTYQATGVKLHEESMHKIYGKK